MPRDLPIAVFNSDNSSLSRTYTRMLDSTPTLDVAYETTSIEEGKDLIIKGKAYALVVIPKHFQKDIYKNNSPQIVSYFNNQLLLVGGMVSKDITVATKTLLAGINIKAKTKRGLPKDVAASQVNIIGVDEHIRSNPYLNYSYFLGITSIAHIMQILIAFTAIWAVGIEFKEGTTIDWLKSSNYSILAGVFGKLFPYFLNFFFLILTIYVFYFGIFSVPCEGNIFVIIFTTALFIAAYQLIGVFFVALAANLRFALSSGAFFTALGFTFAGVTFPHIAMPAFAKVYSNLLPITHYLKIMIDQTLRNIPPKYDFDEMTWLVGLGLFGASFLPRLKKLALDKNQWYKT